MRVSRLFMLCSAALLLLLAIWLPALPFPIHTYNYVFVVDITRSMNTEDYNDPYNGAISRLEKTKIDMLHAVQTLPCGSKVGLGIFSERMPTLLYTPIDVCEDYPVLEASIRHIDWRMAWVADSNISQALYNTLEIMQIALLADSKLVFFTDGHEAPPVNPRYAPDFAYLQSEQKLENWRAGLIVGVGNPGLSKIPKFDQDGVQIGFYTADDVPHSTRFGEPEDPSKIEGYIPRNGPWGTQQIIGTEHMSSVREAYLQQLAKQAMMDYHHLQTGAGLAESLQHRVFADRRNHPTRLSFIFATLSLLLLLFCFWPFRQKWRVGRFGVNAN